MTQSQVLDHVLANDCYLYEQRVKEDGIYFYVRRNGTKKLVVIYPINKDDKYSIPAVCHICEVLCIEAPAEVNPYCKMVRAAKERAKNLEPFKSSSTMN